MTSGIDILIKKLNGRYYKIFLDKKEKIFSEEDLRVSFSSLIGLISEENSIIIPEEHHEYTVLRGRIDSLYGEVIIEYKEPKYLADTNLSPRNMKAIEQVKRHIEGIEKKQNKPINRFLGIIFDGDRIVFIRKRNSIWDLENPVVVNEENFKLLLQRIFSVGLRGKALIIDNLVRDFSILSEDTKEDIRELVFSFIENNEGKINLLFEQWKILFREVCGYDFETKKLEIRELLKIFHINKEDDDLPIIIFAIHTYYAIFIKLLAAETLTYFRHREKSFLSMLTNLKSQITSLESGEIFKYEGVNNFIDGDLFSWYLICWNSKIEKLVTHLVNKLQEYDFSSLNLEPKEAKDLIKNIYHYLLPQKLRHSLGEYYTPDWLAEFIVENLHINYSSNFRALDPTCGSGTFLSILIEKIKLNSRLSGREKLKKILGSIVGIDLNPLAVISAKTNYIIALSDYLIYIDREGTDIPIYLSDSLLAPLEYKTKKKNFFALPTKVGIFKIPISLIANSYLEVFLNLVIPCIEIELDVKDFKKKFDRLDIKISDNDIEIIFEFYETLLGLQKRGLNGIWGKIIKNIFTPAFFKDFDYIVGNPPWINWQNLPEEYRDSIKKYWDDYKIFLHRGLTARLGSAHDDISVLLTYVVIDKYLTNGGKLGFVLPQNLFQASGGGDGFRRFQVKDKAYVRVIQVDDFAQVQPFADMGASNKPASIIIEKGEKTSYPVKYLKWFKKERGTIPSDQPLNAILPLLSNNELLAEPIKREKSNSPWLIAEEQKIKFLRGLIGHSKYRARKGVDFSLNGLFWGTISSSKYKNTVVFNNLYDIGKKKLKNYEVLIERDLIYPILRGKDINRWCVKPEIFSIIPYSSDGKCLSENELKNKYPFTYKFFYKIDPEIERWLETRGIYQKHLKNVNVPKHGLYDIGAYTFSKYKVVWKALASGMISSVISRFDSDVLSEKLLIPDHNVLMVPFETEEEAYFLCGVLNSECVNDFVIAYISWFYSSHVLENINIPSFDRNNKNHCKIIELSKEAHKTLKLEKERQNELNNLAVSIFSSNN